jgi:hypothetical protein
MNTVLHYQYRDENNYKQGERVVLQGAIAWVDIHPFLDEGEYFIPSQVGLDDLQMRFGGISDADHPWHELRADDLDVTDEEPTTDITADELRQRFATVQWDERWPPASD